MLEIILHVMQTQYSLKQKLSFKLKIEWKIIKFEIIILKLFKYLQFLIIIITKS